ncbi:hypothetical protein BDN70DRAFT_166307 [Pholiota conissans]|uniref:MYND-type domain-containing protein n=1 Tax=Pholiota conissans TaxID=109636 RepID=A0A9P5YWP5_9AGAR|nr:hypothetical protein BDN70DRAFT_166307 [Pholiota conissans]
MPLGPSSKEIRKARRRVKPSCTNCLKTSQECGLKRCEMCKVALYCSKECQKKNWPEHKVICTESDGRPIISLIRDFVINEILHTLLGAIVAMKMDILNDPNIRRKPFKVRIEFAIEPVNLVDFHTILESTDDSEPILGMLQLTGIVSNGYGIPLDPGSQRLWERAQKQLDDLEVWDSLVGLVEFTNNDDIQAIVLPLYIHEDALVMLKDGKQVPIPTGNGRDATFIRKSMSTSSYMEVINSAIRFDTENRWLLRRKMRVSDKKVIKDAVANNLQSPAALYFRDKMERELIYKWKR